MASPSLDSFERALRKFKDSLPPAVVQQLSICTLDDVRKVVDNIQRDHGHSGKLRNMKRLEAFIEAMEQFSKVVDVFLNVSEFVCFVWGPIKFLLTISKTYIDSFDKLLDAYSQIGDVIPGLLFYKTAFEKHAPLASVLEDYYSDILRFHSKAIRVFIRPTWKKLFHATWKTFDAEFGSILRSLAQRRELLDGEKSSATLYEVHKIRDDNEAMRTEWREKAKADDQDKHRARLSQIKHKLRAASYQLDQEVSTEDRGWGDSSQWIFQDPRFVSWEDPDSAERCVLYVNGKPGAGKTTLVSAIVERFLNDKRKANKWHSVAYFYFKHDQADRNTFNAMLRALLEQLIDQDPATTAHFFDLLASMADVNLRATKALQDHLKTAFECYKVTYLVLDGLDECAAGEAAKAIEWILSIANQPSPRLRVLFSGQRDGVLDSLLSSQESISLETSAHMEDIRAYTEDFSKQIQAKFKSQASMTQEIVSLVTSEAKGMFLYVRVVLDNLWHQTRLRGLKKELEPGIFPKGLEKAYDRVTARVLEHASEAERQDALKVLGLVASARRILFWREIQAFLCIDPAKAEVDYDERLQVSCKELCGALLDTHVAAGTASGPEDRIQIVHETARQYLFEKKLLHSTDENVNLSTFCLQYLTSKPLGVGLEQHDIVSYAKQGYYALQDYTVQYWFDHLWECVKDTADPASRDIAPLINLTRTFLLSYGLRSKLGKQCETRNHSDMIGVIKNLLQGSRERDSYFDISLRTLWIRQEIEKLQKGGLDLEAEEAFAGLHGGKVVYKCQKPWCDFFTVGFKALQEREKHMNAHDLPFYCPSPDCFASSIGFDSQPKLAKHQKSYHSPDGDLPTFPRLCSSRPKNLCSAAERGDFEAVADFLKLGEDVVQSSRPKGGKTPLLLAAKSGHVDVCKLLLSWGADVNSCGSHGYRRDAALTEAVRAGQVDVVRLLLAQDGIDREWAFEKDTALEIACSQGNLNMAMALLEAEDDFTRLFSKSEGELELACRSGNAALVQLLLQRGYLTLVSERCVEEAMKLGPSGSRITELLLSTGRLVITRSYLLEAAIKSYSPSAVEAILSYPKTKIPLRHLKKCLDLAEEVRFGDTDPIARAMIRDSGLQTGPAVVGDALGDIGADDILHPRQYIKGRDDWFYVANPQVPRVVDVHLHHIFGRQSRVHCVCFSQDGRYLAIGRNNFTHVHEVETGERLCALAYDDPSIREADVYAVCFSACGKYLATGGSCGFIGVWIIHGSFLHSRILGHGDTIYSLDFSKDGRTIASVSADNTVRLWDFETGTNTLAVTVDDVIRSVVISPGMMYVAASSAYRGLVWSVHSGLLVAQLDRTDSRSYSVGSMVFSPSGLNFIGSTGTTIMVWELGLPGGIPSSLEPTSSRSVRTFTGHKNFVASVAMTPNAAWVLSASGDSEVILWDPRTGEIQLQLYSHQTLVDKVTVCPTGRSFATTSRDGQVRVWSLNPLGVGVSTEVGFAADRDLPSQG